MRSGLTTAIRTWWIRADGALPRRKGQEVDPVWKCQPFSCSHTFDVWPVGPLICREVLYVSETATESHYQLKHPKNGSMWLSLTIVFFSLSLVHPLDGPLPHVAMAKYSDVLTGNGYRPGEGRGDRRGLHVPPRPRADTADPARSG